MRTFLQENDFSGKTVYPFATNGGRIGHTLKDLEAACAGAAMREGIDIYFESHRMRTPKAQIERRIESFGK